MADIRLKKCRDSYQMRQAYWMNPSKLTPEQMASIRADLRAGVMINLSDYPEDSIGIIDYKDAYGPPGCRGGS